MMQPLTLTVSGFRSYSTVVTVDFTGKGLTAMLGNTGGGKSSLLEAITYALFRGTTWDARSSGQLIADDCDAMSVEFTFRHDGQRWRVRRTMHASNPNAGRHHLINLDTGEEVDRAKPVDARIESILGMGYETFLRVGLLPQGRFDQLLTAPTKERTARLRELFGADSLTEARRLAEKQKERLDGLIGQACFKRKAMPEDPAQAARDAGMRAAESESRAAHLATALDSISDLREQASMSQLAEGRASDAVRRLRDHAAANPMAALDDLQPLADQLATEAAGLSARSVEAKTQESDLVSRIAACEKAGEGLAALGKAAVTIDGLAARVTEHRDARAAAGTRAAQLTVESDRIATAEQELADRVKQAAPLTAAADAAERVAASVHDRAETLRAGISGAIAAALHAADTSRAHHDALDQLAESQRIAAELTAAESAAGTALRAAEAAVAAVTQRNQSAAIASDLRPGDDCPVCHRQLAESFTPHAAATATDLRQAKATHREAQRDHNRLTDERARAQAKVDLTREQANQLRQNLETARTDVVDATDSASRLMVELATAAETFDAVTAAATLLSATTALSQPGTDTDLDQLTGDIATDVAHCERAADEHTRSLRRHADSHTAILDAERAALSNRKDRHKEAVRAAAADSKRLTAALQRTAADIDALPGHIRALLPTEISDIGPEQTTAATAVIADKISHVQQLVERRDDVQREINGILVEQRTIDQAIRAQIDNPLADLYRGLRLWEDTVTSTLTEHHLDHRVPDRPVKPDITGVRAFAAALAQLTDTVNRELAEISNKHQHAAEAATAKMRQIADTLGDIDGFDPSADLSAPNALHPLVEAKTTASRQAEELRIAEAAAQAQVRPAADLEFAIAAAKARRDAVEVLRVHLVDAKFLSHFIAHNTRALLSIASDLLAELTGDDFGFAENFDIVSRSSGVVHSANRLSGGEKFLASLALALSLAELHSRSGPRLGSLFLDEGFATLDTTVLDTALDVLRTQAGSDRHVMVVSHLRAVAEAVDDVLWIQRETTGSTARWLTAAERDELVNSDLTDGLQAMM
ncbi:SMC family ATPase [Nocardia puris]|nr:SMC family ATPase [Nocardia puris]